MARVAGYRGSSNLKKINSPVDWTPEMLEEYLKCSKDPIYFAEKYMKIVNVDKGLITINLYKYQKEIILSALNNTSTVAECARQSGKTTAVTVFVLWYILFNREKTVAILANKAETAREILGRIQLAYEHLPQWLQHGIKEWNKGSFELENDSRVIAGATTSNNFRGYAINMLIIDEAAFIDNWETFFTSVYPTISSGESTKLVLISTVNGLNHFHEITELAREGKNGYNLIAVTWHDVPGRDQKWRAKTLAGLNFDEEKFAQEFENRYLGSSGTLIAGWKLQIMKTQVPVHKNNNVYLYKHPEKTSQYVGIADVSRGKLLDYSTLQIIDITKMPYEQVLVFRDNTIAPGDFSEVLARLGRWYNNCPMLVEINDIGGQTAESLYFDFEYENVLFTEANGRLGKRITQSFTPGRTDRGVRTTRPVKATGCSVLKLLVEQDKLIINDHETKFELSTFSKKNDSYEAEPGRHDDLVMPLVLFGWLTMTKYFKDNTNINTMHELREQSDEFIMSQLTPFGFIDDGEFNPQPEQVESDVWFAVSEGAFLFK